MGKKRAQGPAKQAARSASRRRRRGIQFWEVAGVAALAVVVVAVMAAFNTKGAEKTPASPTVTSTSAVANAPTKAPAGTPGPVGADAKTLGPADAKVTIIEYGDYQ